MMQLQNSFMAKYSSYLEIMRQSFDSRAEIQTQHRDENDLQKVYKPLVVVGPSGAGKVNQHSFI